MRNSNIPVGRFDEFPLALERSSEQPVFLAIGEAIVRDIARRRLRPGDALPGTRTLAQTLGVHRSTVVAAYAELSAQGWVEAHQGGTTRVASTSPDVSPRRFAESAEPRASVPSRPGFPLGRAPVPRLAWPKPPPGSFVLWGGLPDLRLVPVDLLARAYRRAARRYGRTLYGYTRDSLGHPRLRKAIAELVSGARGLAADADSVMITGGCQMALDLVVRALVEPGDVVAVEALGYFNAFNVFRRAGAKVVPIPVDREGLDVPALAELVQKERVRLVYVTPHHQFPTTVTLSPARRLALLDLARRAELAIVEDDYDQEFHYDGRPVLPLASHDAHGSVIYVGTLAKILAPGLRIGFVVAPPPVIARLADERSLVDRQGDAVLECAVADLIEDGDVQRYARRNRRIYHRRRDAFCAAVDAELGGAFDYERPAGGLALWATTPSDFDLEGFHARAEKRGVFFQLGRKFSFDDSRVPAARFGFALLDEREIAVAVRTLGECLPAARGRPRAPSGARRSS
jgi:GntR family transcriptional regulator/MocR family aminotransferase